jgi:hypothetical protein
VGRGGVGRGVAVGAPHARHNQTPRTAAPRPALPPHAAAPKRPAAAAQLLVSGEHSVAISVDEPIVAALNIYVDMSERARLGGRAANFSGERAASLWRERGASAPAPLARPAQDWPSAPASRTQTGLPLTQPCVTPPPNPHSQPLPLHSPDHRPGGGLGGN